MRRRAEQLGGAAVHFAVVDHAQAVELLAADPDVLGDAHVRHQVEFLVDHRDPGLLRGQGRFKHNRLAAQADFPGVGLVDAGDDFHQGRLARAVLAHQRQHRARAHTQLYIGQGDDAGKAFADVEDFQQVRVLPAPAAGYREAARQRLERA